MFKGNWSAFQRLLTQVQGKQHFETRTFWWFEFPSISQHSTQLNGEDFFRFSSTKRKLYFNCIVDNCPSPRVFCWTACVVSWESQAVGLGIGEDLSGACLWTRAVWQKLRRGQGTTQFSAVWRLFEGDQARGCRSAEAPAYLSFYHSGATFLLVAPECIFFSQHFNFS